MNKLSSEQDSRIDKVNVSNPDQTSYNLPQNRPDSFQIQKGLNSRKFLDLCGRKCYVYQPVI